MNDAASSGSMVAVADELPGVDLATIVQWRFGALHAV